VGWRVPLDTLGGGFVALHLDEGETVFGIAVALDDEGEDFSVLFEVAGEFRFEFFDLDLGSGGCTLPSRLVMKSLVGCWLGEADRCRLEEADSLLELMICPGFK
jgi:hypothetical protein